MRRAAVAIIVVLEPTRGVPVVTTAGAIAPTEQQLILLRVRRVRLARPRKKCDEGRDGVWPRGGTPIRNRGIRAAGSRTPLDEVEHLHQPVPI